MQGSGYTIEELTVGQSDTVTRTVTEGDILVFAGLTGDTNPVHLDEAYAAATPFKGRIAHGMLSAGLISAILGARMPGPGAIYVNQTMKFKAPVRIGDNVTTVCTIKDINLERKRVVLDTRCLVGETVVVEGEATLLVPSGNTPGSAA